MYKHTNRVIALLLLMLSCIGVSVANENVKQWERFEAAYAYQGANNPFTDVELSAIFTHEDGTKLSVDGFYDGNDTYIIRFMPTKQGEWKYVTQANVSQLDGKSGSLTCVPNDKSRKSMVTAGNDHNFVYDDGSLYHPVGTTAYAWIYADKDRREQTVESLQEAGFNKLRFCVFPNSGVKTEPEMFPFVIRSSSDGSDKEIENDEVNGKGEKGDFDYVWDNTRFDVDFFRNLEACISALDEAGVEADLILFHPYDGNRWGFDRMTMETNLRYLKYVIARLSSFNNVWWSMANEWDYVKSLDVDKWKQMSEYVADTDPYGHLLSIHGSTATYMDYNLPYYTHASIQDHGPLYNHEGAATVRNIFPKPIVFDEVCYEGNHDRRWAQLSGEEMVQRMWNGIIGGTYVTHGECYIQAPDPYTGNTFLATGGTFQGTAPARIKFMRSVLECLPASPRLADRSWDEYTASCGDDAYLIYFGDQQPATWVFSLPAKNDVFKPLKGGEKFRVEIIDTWNMTITPCDETFEVKPVPTRRMADKDGKTVTLPERPYIMLKITKI